MKFGHLILGKIFEFVPTRCQILRLKCTKFNCGPLDGFNGPTSKGGEGKWRVWESGRGEGKGKEKSEWKRWEEI